MGHSEAPEKEKKKQNILMRFGNGLRKKIDFCMGKLEDFFVWWGLFVYRRPWTVIVVMLILNGILASGLSPTIFKRVSKAESLYTMCSTACEDRYTFNQYFKENVGRNTAVVVQSKHKGENIFTWKFLEKVKMIDDLVRGKAVNPITHHALEFDHPDEQNKTVNFEDVCRRLPNGSCDTMTVLDMDPLRWKDFVAPGGPELWVFNETDGLVFNGNKQAFVPDYLLGGITWSKCKRTFPVTMIKDALRLTPEQLSKPVVELDLKCVVGAEAYQLIYTTSNATEIEPLASKWESAFIHVFGGLDSLGDLKVTYAASRSRDDELSSLASSDSDMIIVALTFVIITCYAVSVTFSCDLFRSKVYCGVLCVFNALLGCISGLGICAYCGIQFVPTALVTVFLCLGIGCDCGFVFINAYSLAYLVERAQDRVALAVADGGVGITITTTMNIIGLAIGAKTPYLAIRNFCFFSFAGLLMGYINTLTLWLGFFCLDAKREEALQMCCFQLPDKTRIEEHVERRQAADPDYKPPPENNLNAVSMVSFKSKYLIELQKRDRENRDKMIQNSAAKQLGIKNPSGGHSSVQKTPNGRNSLNVPQISGAVNITPRMEVQYDSNGVPISRLRPAEETRKPMKGFFFQAVFSAPMKLFGIGDETEKKNGVSGNGVSGSPTMISVNGAPVPQEMSTVSMAGKTKIPEELHQDIWEEPKGLLGRKWRIFLLKYYGRALTNIWVKLFIVAFFFVRLVLAIVGIQRMEFGLDLSNLVGDKSYLLKYDRAIGQYFARFDFPTEVYYSEKEEWWRKDVQDKMFQMTDQVKAIKDVSVVLNPFTKILTDPELVGDLRSGNRQRFNNALNQALSNPKSKYVHYKFDFIFEKDIDPNTKTVPRSSFIPAGPASQNTTDPVTGQEKLYPDRGDLVSFKYNVLPRYMVDSQERGVFMNDIRNVMDRFLHEETPSTHPRPWNYLFMFVESDQGLLPNTVENVCVDLSILMLIALITIDDARSVIMVITLMGFLNVEMMGFMYWWDLKLSMLTSINLVISIGFSVDYLTHMCHSFVHCEGETRNLKMIEALTLMGSSVFSGAMCAFLGVALLGFSSSYIFRVFFKMITLSSFLGMSHALMLLPVMLSWVGTVRSHHGDDDEETDGDGKAKAVKDEDKTSTAPNDTPNLDIDTRTPPAPFALPHHHSDTTFQHPAHHDMTGYGRSMTYGGNRRASDSAVGGIKSHSDIAFGQNHLAHLAHIMASGPHSHTTLGRQADITPQNRQSAGEETPADDSRRERRRDRSSSRRHRDREGRDESRRHRSRRSSAPEVGVIGERPTEEAGGERERTRETEEERERRREERRRERRERRSSRDTETRGDMDRRFSQSNVSGLVGAQTPVVSNVSLGGSTASGLRLTREVLTQLEQQ